MQINPRSMLTIAALLLVSFASHAWAQPTRALLLAGAIGWSLYLAWQVISRYGANGLRRLAAFICVSLGAAIVAYGWYLQFWGWS